MEPEIKLFGRKIMLTDDAETSDESADGCCDPSSRESKGSDGGDKIMQSEEDKVTETNEPERTKCSVIAEDESQNPATVESSDENPSGEGETMSANENDAKQKILKKPDKILPCPRCNSMGTKFCYYNNYNINQPRHFCKSCQRYWTAGGTMRNLPVGAGRRRSKNSPQQIIISEVINGARNDDSNNLHVSAIKPSSTVLSFTPDSSYCESLASGLKHKRVQISHENGDCSTKSTPQVPIPPPVHCVPGVAWPYPAVPIYPMPLMPPPYWNYAVPNPWIVPWLPVFSPSTEQIKNGFAPPVTPLGKHSRNGELLKVNIPESENVSEPEKSDNCIVVPKTLRVDDPEEAAKSSIWETLGIKYDSFSRGGLFKALQPKDQKENVLHSTPQTLQANPAALSRSITFHETA